MRRYPAFFGPVTADAGYLAQQKKSPGDCVRGTFASAKASIVFIGRLYSSLTDSLRMT
jgi:hypothetical protein